MSPQNVQLLPSAKGSIKQRIVQNAFGPMHKSLHIICLKTTRRVLILAPRGSRRHTKDCSVTLENGPSPSALRGALAAVGGGLASAFEPLLRLRKGPRSGMVLLMVADVFRLSQVTHFDKAPHQCKKHPGHLLL